MFGAEQIQESKLTSRFFDKYVIVINISSIFAVLGIRSIVTASSGLDKYQIPSIIAASVLLTAAILFVSGYRYYIHVPPHDTVITNIFPVYKNAFETRSKYRRSMRITGRARLNSVPSNSFSSIHSAIGNESTTTTVYNEPMKFLDFAKGAYGGKFPDRMVDDVKSLRKALMVFTSLIPYWIIYQQVNLSNKY